MKLALGTVQFGMPYGIANTSGRIPASEVPEILQRAKQAGIDTLDTAAAYGESEAVLGQAGVDDWKVITKLPPLPPDCQDAGAWVEAEVRSSLSRLGVTRVRGLLLHSPSQLLGERGPELLEALMAAKRSGFAELTGISIYDPEELDRLADVMRPEIVQAPMNILDRRMLDSGWLNRLNAAGTEVHARSAFLQGLLLMSRDSRPQEFHYWAPIWDLWHHWLDEKGLTPVEACIRYVSSLDGVTKVVVGVDGSKQLVEIIAAAQGEPPELHPDLQTNDTKLLNPAKWNRL